MGIFSKFSFGLKKTRDKMNNALDDMFDSYDEFEDGLFTELEEILVMGDVGMKTAFDITEELKARVAKQKIKSPSEAKGELMDIVADMLYGGEDMGLITIPSIILMIGVNDLTYDDTAWGRMYRGVLQKLKGIVPDALIYAHAILPINDSKTGSGEKMWRVNAKNKVIKSAAEAEGVGYLGIPPEMLDSNGQLPYGAASDGVHFGITYCRIWYNWVKEQLK